MPEFVEGPVKRADVPASVIPTLNLTAVAELLGETSPGEGERYKVLGICASTIMRLGWDLSFMKRRMIVEENIALLFPKKNDAWGEYMRDDALWLADAVLEGRVKQGEDILFSPNLDPSLRESIEREAWFNVVQYWTKKLNDSNLEPQRGRFIRERMAQLTRYQTLTLADRLN